VGARPAASPPDRSRAYSGGGCSRDSGVFDCTDPAADAFWPPDLSVLMSGIRGC
jgi:hypothetical protein